MVPDKIIIASFGIKAEENKITFTSSEKVAVNMIAEIFLFDNFLHMHRNFYADETVQSIIYFTHPADVHKFLELAVVRKVFLDAMANS